jgi:hypothetical protein
MSDSTTTEIVPQAITEVKLFTYFVIHVDQLTLFECVSLRVDLLDANKGYIKTEYFKLCGQDYTDWGNNDEYIVNKVAQLLGVTPVQASQ